MFVYTAAAQQILKGDQEKGLAFQNENHRVTETVLSIYCKGETMMLGIVALIDVNSGNVAART
jgi:hypothetical protein